MTRRKRAEPRDPFTLTGDDLAAIAQVVEEIRMDAGTGGQCGFVAEVLADRYGWAMYGGVYHAPDGHPIGDHVWNVHEQTGAIIDATADQFGEGLETRVIAADQPLHGRYRWADSEEQEQAWLDAARGRDEREGDYWWVPGGAAAPAVVAYEERVTHYETAPWPG